MILLGTIKSCFPRQSICQFTKTGFVNGSAFREICVSNQIKSFSIQSGQYAKQLKHTFDNRSHFHKDSKEIDARLLTQTDAPEPSRFTTKKMFALLSAEPTLIHESRRSRLYTILSLCFGACFLVYGINVFYIGREMSLRIYNENEDELTPVKNKLRYAGHLSLVVVASTLTALCGVGLIMLPSKLVNKMWYLPGAASKAPSVKFTTHSFIPYTAKELQMPITNIKKNRFAKIYTGVGAYGTDDTLFIFWLKQKGSRIPWLVDRKGYFWGDGRVFDLLFNDVPADPFERAEKIDQTYSEILKKKREEGLKIKREQSSVWRNKSAGHSMAQDVEKIIKATEKSRSNTPKPKKRS
ncbi:hypothetical protein OGAPHI_002324 [Ogataea philodendri]|uniref:Uncharacterized protein n=1 Tax=Ogataea philodendri TaxID=1378263 RepID=A0A9P8T7V5_9ASCO|nr:uncharacterized protein OGAPHI_002324 [Ogataea philodendri]KAH3668570.1 hypothetical protein OGAPHI_002324 [Ogataea philodendri]